MTLIKVCGVTTLEDARFLATSGVDWIGLNFWRESSRYVDRLRARTISVEAKRVNPNIKIVGVFVNHSAKEIEAASLAAKCDYVQLHGDESPVFAKRFGDNCIKAMSVQHEMDVGRFLEYECKWMLVDAAQEGYGGSGALANWELAARVASRRDQVWLAGGLAPDNVAAAIAKVKPYGVDVASGVESAPGVKDREKVAAFVAAVRRCS